MLYLFLLKTESLDNAIILSKYGNCTRLLKIKNKLKIGCFYRQSRKEFSIFCGRF